MTGGLFWLDSISDIEVFTFVTERVPLTTLEIRSCLFKHTLKHLQLHQVIPTLYDLFLPPCAGKSSRSSNEGIKSSDKIKQTAAVWYL